MIKFALRLAVLLFLFASCGSKQEVSEVSAFWKYISAYTSGQVSKYTTIRVMLSNEVPEAEAGKVITDDAFEFSPKIKGVTSWIDSKTIEFRPDEPLKGNQEFIAKFHLAKFRQVEKKELETFVFKFKTIKQAITVEMNYPVISDNGELTLDGQLFLTDKDELENIQKIISLKSDDFKDLQIEWKELKTGFPGYRYDFSILGITQGDKDQTLYVRYDGSPVKAENKGEEEVVIPANPGLQLVGHKIYNGEDAHIQLYFNSPLQAKQDFKSLCYFSKDVSVTFVQEGSLLKIYPSKIFFDCKDLTINQNLRNTSGKKLGEDQSLSICFESIKPAVRLISKGTILPGAKGITIPFQTVNLRAVDVYVLKIFENNIFQFLQVNQFNGQNEIKRVARPVLKKTIHLDYDKLMDLSTWRTFSLDLSELIQQEPGAIYRVVFRMKKSYSLYPCGKEDSNESPDMRDTDLEEWDKTTYYYYDYDYDDYDYDEHWRNRDNPCHQSYYTQNHRNAETNIFASNLGIIAKAGGNNNFFAIVTNLLTAEPESDAEVIFYNYQQQPVGNGKTDGKGFVEIPLNIKPYFLEVKKGNQRGYLRLDDGSSLSLSNFDVSGAQYKKGLKGFIYGERGVWRPGDTLHVTFIIQDEDKVLPKDHPITMEFKNPRNQLHSKQMQKYSDGTFYVFQIPTTNDVPTGQWDMKIQVGGSVFSKTFWIETVKPNRLKVTLDVNTDVIRSGSVPRFTLQSAWLHGATASNKDADVKVKYRRSRTSFPDYKEYVFESPISNEFTSEEKVIFEGKTDADGMAVFTKEMPRATNAPGMLQADFTTRVFEGEGDFSVNYKTVEFSPYRAYIGVRVPKVPNSQGILYTNRKHNFDIVVVDEKGKPADSNDIQFTMYKLSWRWWWDSSYENDLAYYINNDYVDEYFSKNDISTSKGKASVSVEVPNDDWGRYLICVKDNNGEHLTGAVVYFDWEDWLGRSSKNNPSGATMLTFSTDKEKYNVGDKVKVTIPSSQKGRALVTIENRSRVISARWVESKGENSVFEVEVTPEMSPNAYIHVTFLQPHSNTENDLPIRLYGVKNIMVDDKNSHLYPIIKMPDVVEPEKEFTVNVSEKEGKDMTYTLAIVDEGLLDLTNFKTPDPHPVFYAREALGVNTWDMFNYVIGAYGGKIEQLFGIGGDMSVKDADQDKTNSRFKPVVKFIGPCELKAGKTNTHKITLPAYFGSVRTMVVAGNTNAYGNAEKAVKVQKPLMVMATLPRVAGPNEEISLPVNVFVMEDKIKDVTVTVSSGNILKTVGTTSQKLSFDKTGDKVVTFQLKASDIIGKETVKVKAVSGSNTAEYEVILEVRNPNPRVTESKSFILQPGEKKEIPYELPGVAGTNTLTLEIARIPSLNLEKRLGYLIGYPHGCAEQTTSKGFPQLFLPSLMALSTKEAEESEKNVKSTILKLSQMQRGDGAVVYWMGGNYTYDWVTTYAGHFMLEAKDKGYAVSPGFLNNWANYQKQKAQSWSAYDDDLEQAYRLYTLALFGKPELGAMNRLRESSKLSTAAAWRLAAAYALDGKPEVARKLISDRPSNMEDYSAFNNTFGSSLRDNAMILETLVLLKEHEQALKQAQIISKQLNENSWYSTQTTAYALVAMSKFAGFGKTDKNIKIAYVQDGEPNKKESKESIFRTSLNATKKNSGIVSLVNEGEGIIFADLTQSGIPLEDKTPAGSNGMTMTVQYTDVSGNPVNIETLQQGVDFLANVTIKNTSNHEKYNEISLIHVFPSGWEILNDRMQNGPSDDASAFSYQDIRDDRVLTYFNLKPREEKTIIVQLHAAYAGKFLLPATLCEAMYDTKIFARNQGKWVNVVK